MRATREDSGWKTDEPVPTRAAASSIKERYAGATDSSSKPTSVNPIPTGERERQRALVGVRPTSGCSSEAVELVGQGNEGRSG